VDSKYRNIPGISGGWFHPKILNAASFKDAPDMPEEKNDLKTRAGCGTLVFKNYETYLIKNQGENCIFLTRPGSNIC
jgi:hypothetical protein